MDSMAVDLIFLKELRTESGFVSAASGLVFKNNKYYVISDDELFLYEFDLLQQNHFRQVRLFQGELPEKKSERKKLKPDLESLTLLSNGNLLAVPSGSKANRQMGCVISNNHVKHNDFSPLFKELVKQFPEPNIEGAVFHQNDLLLFQRGNGSQAMNAVVTTDFSKMSIRRSDLVELKQMEGLPLSFTDAATDSQNRIWFLAVAEDTTSTYEDGEFRGAVLGCLDQKKNVIFQDVLSCPHKPEGLWIEKDQFYIVTDADTRLIPSRLLKGTLPQF